MSWNSNATICQDPLKRFCIVCYYAYIWHYAFKIKSYLMHKIGYKLLYNTDYNTKKNVEYHIKQTIDASSSWTQYMFLKATSNLCGNACLEFRMRMVDIDIISFIWMGVGLGLLTLYFKISFLTKLQNRGVGNTILNHEYPRHS